MNILLYLDPFSTDLAMAKHRSIVYINFYNEFIKHDFKVKIYTSIAHKEEFNKIPSDVLIFSDLQKYLNSNIYLAMAHNNIISDSDLANVYSDFEASKFIPDIIITNTPSGLPKRIWRDANIYHYELGFFNRPPFPIFHQLDPLGYYHKSMLSQFPWRNLPIEESIVENFHEIRSIFLSELNFDQSKIGSINALYVPLPSLNTLAMTIEINDTCRVDYLNGIVKKFPGKLIMVNEKPQYPLSDFEKDSIFKIKSIEVVDNKDLNGMGSYLALLCNSTYTFSPSLSLQSIFWGNKLYCPEECSMKAWSVTQNSFDKLAAYVGYFNFIDYADSVAIISNSLNSKKDC